MTDPKTPNISININSADVANTVALFIEKISEGFKGFFRPLQTVREAKADIEAQIIRAEGVISLNDLQRRALVRVAAEEAQHQANMEAIAAGAFPKLASDARPQDVTADWIANFFDKCRNVSDADMQQLWSSILAGEANSPKSFSRKTVNLLADLDVQDAKSFESLCRYSCCVNDRWTPMIIGYPAEIFKVGGFSGSAMVNLDALGLISDSVKDGNLCIHSAPTIVKYFDKTLFVHFKPNIRPSLPFGRVKPTRAGRELSAIIKCSPVDGFVDHLVRRFNRACESVEITDSEADVASDQHPPESN